MPPAVVRKNGAPSVSELVPMHLTNANKKAIVTGANAYWDGQRGMMEGVANGTVLPFKWKEWKRLQGLRPAVPATPPIIANDPAIGKDYLKLGYGGALARRTLTCVSVRLVSGGAGYVNSETLTLTNGVKVQVAVGGHTGGVITSAGFTMTDPGTFVAQPSVALVQTGTTGAGTGATFIAEFATNCGSLALQPLPGIIPANTFTLIAAFRCPVVGGVAGADPGGFIVGGQLNQTEIQNSTANARWWGLRLGSAALPGRLIGHIAGDAQFAVTPFGYDYRDGLWHVAMLTFGVGATGSCKLWVDGVNLASHTGGAFANLNITVGNDMLRIGAAGLPAQGPIGGAAMDIGAVLIEPLDLSAGANDARRQLIGNQMLAEWLGGGAWA